MYINRIKFFDAYKKEFGKIKYHSTVDNLNTMLRSFEKYSRLFNPNTLIEQISYVAATVHHETGTTYGTMKEKRASWRQPALKRLQDRYWGSGYYGRGPVQLTWYSNYKWAEKVTSRPLVKNPDLLLKDLELGYEVTIKGMVQGAYTGKSLDDTITKGDKFIDDRIIVNGKDRAVKIAGYAKKFYKIFTASVEKD